MSESSQLEVIHYNHIQTFIKAVYMQHTCEHLPFSFYHRQDVLCDKQGTRHSKREAKRKAPVMLQFSIDNKVAKFQLESVLGKVPLSLL